MLLSIITLNYKKPTLTINCIASLYEQFSQEFQADKLEVIIVDNDSRDDSVEKIGEDIKKNHYKNVRLIANNENGGFGKGCNTGAAQAKGDFILFLNNDTLVQDHGILDMAKYMQEHTEVAILGGALQNPDGSHQSSASEFFTPAKVFLLLLGLQKFGAVDQNPKEIAQVDWVKGALFMIRSEVFRKLGGFDEQIFMYTEDMELCYRAKLTGYKTYFYPDVTVVHAEHASSNRSFAVIHIYKGLLYFYKKHRSYPEYSVLRIFLLAKAFVAIAVGVVTRNSYLTNTYRKAIRF